MSARLVVVLVALACLALAACGGGPAATSLEPGSSVTIDPAKPEAAVLAPVQAIGGNDLAGVLAHTVAPATHEQMARQWKQSLADLDPKMRGTIDKGIRSVLDTETTNTMRGVVIGYLSRIEPARMADQARQAVATVGGMSLISGSGLDPQLLVEANALIGDAATWMEAAGLDDRNKAGRAYDAVVKGFRQTGITSVADVEHLDLDHFLARLAPVVAAGKEALALYGLDLDAVCKSFSVEPKGEGDQRSLAVSFDLWGKRRTLEVPTMEVDGRWLVSGAEQAIGLLGP